MKKILALVLALAMILSLAACGGSSSDSADNGSADAGSAGTEITGDGTVNTKDVINVGYIQLLDMVDSDFIYQGIIDTIAEAGLADSIIVDRQSASGDVNLMGSIIQGFVDDEVDLIVPVLTPPAQAAVSITQGSIPIIFASVVDPVYSQIIPSWDSINPANLATGTSNTIPADLLIDTALQITPIEDGKEIAIFYNTSQNNSQCTMEAATAYCDEQNLPYTVYGYADVNEAVTTAQGLDADATAFVYVTLDSAIAASYNAFGEAINNLGIPSYGVADAMVRGGAFCSYGVDYTIVGNMTGQMIIDWYNGTPLESMLCQRYGDFSLVINEDTIAALGIELPADLAEQATYIPTASSN